MDQLMQNLSSNPVAMGIVIFMALLLVYFLFKQLVKMALLILIILIAVCGYFYFKDPEKMPENVMETLGKAKVQTERMVEKGKNAYQAGKAVVEKGKKLTEGMDSHTAGKEKKTDRKPDKGP